MAYNSVEEVIDVTIRVRLEGGSVKSMKINKDGLTGDLPLGGFEEAMERFSKSSLVMLMGMTP